MIQDEKCLQLKCIIESVDTGVLIQYGNIGDVFLRKILLSGCNLIKPDQVPVGQLEHIVS